MRQVMVRYKVKPERVEENEELVRAVYDELHRDEPAGLRYATFKLDDGVSFVHLALTEDEGQGSPLQKVRAFQEFSKHLRDRTEEGPVAAEFDQIGSFRLIGDASVH